MRKEEIKVFYFLFAPILTYNIILVAAAVIPAIVLMVKVYQSDRLEKESSHMLWIMVRSGILSALIALVLERLFGTLLSVTIHNETLYQVLLYFVVVALSEEGAKFFMFKKNSWGSAEFDCQFDGIVYAVFVSLGFALWENISYVLHYGFSAALIRALTAIPGHTCFGVFMGLFYGTARKLENRGESDRSRQFRYLTVIIPAVLHGAYDYIASREEGTLFFVIFIAVLFFVSYRIVSRMSKVDHYI